jgi:hypothetical protein
LITTVIKNDQNTLLNETPRCPLKLTRNAGTQGHKSNSIDCVLQVDVAAEMTGHVTNDSGAKANKDDGNYECWVSVVNGCSAWKEKRKKQG